MMCSVARLSVPASKVTCRGVILPGVDRTPPAPPKKLGAPPLCFKTEDDLHQTAMVHLLCSPPRRTSGISSDQPPRMILDSWHLASVRNDWSPPRRGLQPEVRLNPFFNIPAMNKRIIETVCRSMTTVPGATALFQAWNGAMSGFIQISACPAYTPHAPTPQNCDV